LLKFRRDFVTADMRPPSQALPSFRVELVVRGSLSGLKIFGLWQAEDVKPTIDHNGLARGAFAIIGC
jgi:hypothetical protein